MKFGLRKGWAILLGVLSFCISCGDAELLDTNKWSDHLEDWTPSVKGAIAWGTFTVWDFLQDSTRDFQVEKEYRNGDSILVVKYTQPNIKSIDIAEVFKLEGTSVEFEENLLPKELKIALEEHKSISIDDFYLEKGLECKFDTSVYLSLPLPKEFDKTDLRQITLSRGTCICELPKFATDLEYELSVTYKSEGKDKELLNENKSEKSLENETFDLVLKNKIPLTIKLWLKKGTINGDFKVKVTFFNYDFSVVRGNIVNTKGIGIAGDFDMSMDLLNDLDIDDKILFTDPKVKLVMKNKGLGIPLEVDMKFSGTNTDSVLTLYKPLAYNGSLSADTSWVENWVIDSTNSNIVNFLAELPRGKMEYSGEVTVNPKGVDTCVIYKDGSLDLDLNVEVPVALKIDSLLSYSKSLTNLSLDQQYTDKIKEGTISLRVEENALPLDLSIPKLILLDENNRHLDTIAVISDNRNEGKIKAGEKDGVLSFKINEDTAKKLGQMQGILLEAAVSGGTGEPLRANAQLKFVLLLEVKAIVNDLNGCE
ncbi:MAG: hypothetical protein K2I90_01670 [Odoribacter sp.]|nr:hypothetical protein [Odoribacter sp.]